MSELPRFDRSRNPAVVEAYAEQVFRRGSVSYLTDLVHYDDGHYRVIFNVDYFVITAGRTEPSRSQWNTLKKHMKRIDKSVFVFKQHGVLEDGAAYIDFGFFQD